MTTRTATPPRSRPRTPAGRRPGRGYRIARWVGLAAVVGLVVAIVVVLSRDAGTDAAPPAPAADSVTAPANLGPGGSVVVGDGPVTVAVYLDYLCPACGAFEAANGGELERMLDAGEITVELRPIAFLDHLSAGTEYSTRAANALATVVDGAPDSAWTFHRALYAHQPAEGGPGLTDDQLVELATSAGVPADVAARFADRTFEAWTADRTAQAFADGVQGTPTILVDGQPFAGDPYSVGDLTAAVAAAR